MANWDRDQRKDSSPTPEAESASTNLGDRQRLAAMHRRHLQRKAAAKAAAKAPIPQGGGASLEEGSRAQMQQVGGDLSDVRVHTGGDSARAASGMGARAFTDGKDIHFNAGEYAPGTRAGDELLAHELTHVVQGQKSGVERKADPEAENEESAEVSQPEDPAEKEADRVAEEAADNLHGGKQEDEPEQPAEKPAATAAKLDGTKLHRAESEGASSQVEEASGGEASSAFGGDQLKSATGPKKTASGALAQKAALELLRKAEPTTVNSGAMGPVTMTPGTTFGELVLLQQLAGVTYYIDGEDLYECSTPDFLRDIWLSAVAKGAKSAEWLEPIAKAEFDLALGFILNTRGAMAFTFVKAMAFLLDHKDEVKIAYNLLKELRRGWQQFEQKCPVCAKNLWSWAGHEMWEHAGDMFKKGLELEDVAYFVGRVLGTKGITGRIESGVALTVKYCIFVTVEMAVLVGALHAPSILGRGIEEAIKHKAQELKKKVEGKGLSVLLPDAEKMIKEFREHPDAETMLGEIRNSLSSLGGSLLGLTASWKKEIG